MSDKIAFQPANDDPVRTGADGLPYARTVAAFLRMSPEQQAQLISADTSWMKGGSGASPTSRRALVPAPEPPAVFDADDRSVGIRSEGGWHPSAEEMLGTRSDTDWK
jgi:hypothetical protein